MDQPTGCPLPGTFEPASFGEAIRLLRGMSGRYWLKATVFALGAAIVIGIPTVIIPNGLFVRDVATTVSDYIIFALSIVLIGMTWALPAPTPTADGEKQSLFGAIGTFLAVGCPTCNKIVLLLIGSSGALTYFAPLQPLLGLAAIFLIIAALRRRLGQIAATGPA